MINYTFCTFNHHIVCYTIYMLCIFYCLENKITIQMYYDCVFKNAYMIVLKLQESSELLSLQFPSCDESQLL